MNGSGNSSLRTYLVYLFTVVLLISVAGALGFYYFEAVADPNFHNKNVHSIWDAFWWTLVTLTTIGYGDVYPETGGGRIIAALLMFVGIGTLGVMTAGIAAYFVKNNQLELLRLRRIRDHVVICGLGETGLLLAKAFRERGHAVLAIEENEANDRVQVCRELGGFVLIGDATEIEMLMRARVAEARYLIAVCGADGANAEVAAHARELVGERRHQRVLTCTTHIVDPELWFLLRKWELATVGPFRLQFFNVFDLGARALLSAYPPFPEKADSAAAPAPHLLVVGAGKLGQNVVVHAARLWRDRHVPARERLRVTIVDRETDHLKESLYLRHPGLEPACEIATHSISPQSPQFQQAAFLFDAHRHLTITAVYVCLEEDSLALSAALSLLHRVRQHQVPVVVRMTQDAGLTTLLQSAQSGGTGGFDHLHAFGLLERICHPDLVLGGTNEALARAIHEQYLREQEAMGKAAGSSPAIVPWEKLTEELKESNRSQAGHIGLKLQAIGCDLAPLTEWDAHAFEFAPDEVEQMARMEQDRWVAERRSQGWTHGPRDNEKKTNPYLVTWEGLPEEIRESNRSAIRGLPASLARAGFQIYRLRAV